MYHQHELREKVCFFFKKKKKKTGLYMLVVVSAWELFVFRHEATLSEGLSKIQVRLQDLVKGAPASEVENC